MTQPYGMHPLSMRTGMTFKDQCPIPSPKKLKDKCEYEDLSRQEINVITPDFEGFAREIIDCMNRSQLNQVVRLTAKQRGFDIKLVYGRNENKCIFQCHCSGPKGHVKFETK